MASGFNSYLILSLLILASIITLQLSGYISYTDNLDICSAYPYKIIEPELKQDCNTDNCVINKVNNGGMGIF